MNYVRYKYHILLTLFVIALFALAYRYYYYYNIPNNNISDNIPEFGKLEDYPSFSPDIRNSTIENTDVQLQKIDASLASEETSDFMRNILLFQKAGKLAFNQIRGTMDENKYFEAMEILGSVYNTLPAKTDKNFSALSNLQMMHTMNTLLSSCVLAGLGEKLPAPYDGEYRNFLAKGHSPKASALLAVLSFAHNADQALSNDIRVVALRAFLSAIYLDAFGKEYNDLDKDIFQKLNADVAIYSELYENYNSPSLDMLVFSSFPYAYAYDIAKTYNVSGIEEETNKKIDANYEFSIDIAKKVGENSVTQNINLANRSIFYFESLHRRYAPEKLDREKVSSLIDMHIESASYSKETKNAISMFYLNGTTEEGKWYPVRNRLLNLNVAKKYPELEDFIENLAGITL